MKTNVYVPFLVIDVNPKESELLDLKSVGIFPFGSYKVFTQDSETVICTVPHVLTRPFMHRSIRHIIEKANTVIKKAQPERRPKERRRRVFNFLDNLHKKDNAKIAKNLYDIIAKS